MKDVILKLRFYSWVGPLHRVLLSINFLFIYDLLMVKSLINYCQAGMKYFLRKTTVFFDFLTVRCLFVFFVVLIWQLYVLFMI